jgi:AraC-like DNA-binding protein
MGNGRVDYNAVHALDAQFSPHGLHSHDYYELYLHFGGCRFMGMDNQVFALQPNQLIVIPPFCLHGLTPESAPVNYERGYLNVSASVLRRCGGGEIDLIRFFHNCAEQGRNQCILSDEEAQLCRKLLMAIREGMEDDSPTGRFSNHARIVYFLQLVCQSLKRSFVSAEPVVVNEAMQEVLAYINNNFTRVIRLEALARQFGVSVSFLSHEFVKYTGRSVYDYVLYRRVVMAKELINTNAALSEVAFRCGFADYSNFLRIFRKVAGITPTEYRKQVHQLREG